MAKRPETVKEFLDDLMDQLMPLARIECEELYRIKQQQHEELGLPVDK